ncbi:hypothetical protein [Salinicoccus albus]|uniref:hypothetical protein n=1 Tax=Salinicoccus albus TaxID=418756 RepID=UPI000382737C|nr:hypothetical protein [Salinicoccus albus]
MIKEQGNNISKNSPFKFNVAKAVSESKEPKRNKEGKLMVSRKDIEGREWYYYG